MSNKTLKERVSYWHSARREAQTHWESKKQKHEEKEEWLWLYRARTVVEAIWPWATVLNGCLLLHDDNDLDVYVITPPDWSDNIINEAATITKILDLLGFQQIGEWDWEAGGCVRFKTPTEARNSKAAE